MRGVAMPEKVTRRAKFWVPGPVLDQGQEGACVGFGWTGTLAASPNRIHTATDDVAKSIYKLAQQYDDWPGEDYEGSSVLGGAKGLKAQGFLGEYRWCFGIEDLIDAVITTGPVAIGIDWYEEMYETEPSGLVKVGGEKVGGHCLYVYGYNPKKRLKGVRGTFEACYWRNSWGSSYGINGEGIIRAEDLAVLLQADGEAVVPTVKNTKKRFQ
jgi:C1A family cysteine protease